MGGVEESDDIEGETMMMNAVFFCDFHQKEGILDDVYVYVFCLLTASRCISGLVMLWDTNPHQRPPQP